MRTIYVLAIVLWSVTQVFAQEQPVESNITGVTVFLNKAQINRRVKTKIEAGKIDLVLTRLTSQIDVQSIQVSGKGNFLITATSHRQNYINEFTMPKSLRVLKDSITYLQQQRIAEENQKDILNKEEQLLLANQKIGGNNQNITVAELKAMADFYRTRLGDIAVAKRKADEKIAKVQERATKLQLEINEKAASYSRNTSEIVVSLSADAPATVELTVSYIVNAAGWYPFYDLRATDTKSPVRLHYKANVYQETGEEWENVKVVLSTVNPTIGNTKQELSPWFLNLYRRDYYSYALKKDAPAAGLMAPTTEDEKMVLADSMALTTSDFVSTIQTSLNTEFKIDLPYTIHSGNKPTAVSIRDYNMKADYIYSVTPKLDKDAFLLARATGWEEFNLLPGEANVFFEGTFVGKSYIDPNNTRDTLDISLGRDKRVIVQRERVKEFSSKKFIGLNQRESFAYEISIRNTKSEPLRILIEDQIPVSQNDQIEVIVGDTGGAQFNGVTGKLIWEITLQPNETKKVAFKFDIKYPKGQSLAGL